MSFSFHPEAEEEFLHTIDYYEDIQTGLGLDFSTEVYSAIQRIVSYPSAWSRLSEKIRRCLLNRFPYGVLYSIEDGEIYIIALMNLQKKPGYWKGRIR